MKTGKDKKCLSIQNNASNAAWTENGVQIIFWNVLFTQLILSTLYNLITIHLQGC